MNVAPLNALAAPNPIEKIGAGQAENKTNPLGASFAQALNGLSQAQHGSDALIQKLAAGEEVDLHQVMIAAEQTDIQFKVALAMRDRLVEAYHEVMRMQV